MLVGTFDSLSLVVHNTTEVFLPLHSRSPQPIEETIIVGVLERGLIDPNSFPTIRTNRVAGRRFEVRAENIKVLHCRIESIHNGTAGGRYILCNQIQFVAELIVPYAPITRVLSFRREVTDA